MADAHDDKTPDVKAPDRPLDFVALAMAAGARVDDFAMARQVIRDGSEEDGEKSLAAYLLESGAADSENFLLKRQTSPPAGLTSYAELNILPDPNQEGLMAWPDYPPHTLQDVASQHLAVQAVVDLRIRDVMRYSAVSEQPWKEGWRITTRARDYKPSRQDRQDMMAAQQFLLMGGFFEDALERDDAGILPFHQFLTGIVRDTLVLDGIAVWTERDRMGRVHRFKALDAGYIRMARLYEEDGKKKGGYRHDPKLFAVAVDEIEKVKYVFTRSDLIWYIRNVRNDPRVGPYGYSEITQAVELITAFNKAIELNKNVFDRRAVPPGFLVIQGPWSPTYTDLLVRIWKNMQRGVKNSMGFPVLKAPIDGKIDFMEIKSEIRGAYMEQFMALMIGVISIIYGIPKQRLVNYINVQKRGNSAESETDVERSEERDEGKISLLTHLENLINDYLIWPRWPQLQFGFTGKDPREDARQYQQRYAALTYGEQRTAEDLPSLADQYKDDEQLHRMAQMLEMIPGNPAYSGVMQTIAGAVMKAAGGETDEQGAIMQPQKDPAQAGAHGHQANIRRDSAKESGKKVS